MHHTDKFNHTKVIIVRRGLSFNFLFSSSDPLESLSVDFGSSQIGLTANVSQSTGMVTINIPLNAPIGTTKIEFFTILSKPTHRRTPSVFVEILIVFNPYHRDELTYIEPKLIYKYLETEVGNYYVTTYEKSQLYARRQTWIYSQYSTYALDSVVFLLSRFKGNRTSPASIARYFTYALAYQPGNEYGVLWGKWELNFSGGSSPLHWLTSEEIFRQYVLSNFRTVKFGQCWIFSGLMTTVLRILGIPNRQITGFDILNQNPNRYVSNGITHISYTRTPKHFLDKNGDHIDYNDSRIWNFHVWNEMWSQVETAVGGREWLVIDATPQQTSENGIFEMGPAPVSSVRLKQDLALYDAAFFITEVSSMVTTYMQFCDFDNSSRCEFAMIGVHEVCSILLAGRMDVTSRYKDREPNYARMGKKFPIPDLLFVPSLVQYSSVPYTVDRPSSPLPLPPSPSPSPSLERRPFLESQLKLSKKQMFKRKRPQEESELPSRSTVTTDHNLPNQIYLDPLVLKLDVKDNGLGTPIRIKVKFESEAKVDESGKQVDTRRIRVKIIGNGQDYSGNVVSTFGTWTADLKPNQLWEVETLDYMKMHPIASRIKFNVIAVSSTGQKFHRYIRLSLLPELQLEIVSMNTETKTEPSTTTSSTASSIPPTYYTSSSSTTTNGSFSPNPRVSIRFSNPFDIALNNAYFKFALPRFNILQTRPLGTLLPHQQESFDLELGKANDIYGDDANLDEEEEEDKNEILVIAILYADEIEQMRAETTLRFT